MTDESKTDDGLTQRERRAQHHKDTKPTMDPEIIRKAIGPALVFLLIAGIGAGVYFTATSSSNCPDHWHATFDIYVTPEDGEAFQVSYVHRQYDLNTGQTPLSAHMHQGDRINQIHYEDPSGDCTDFDTFMRYVDTDISNSRIVLDGAHSDLGQAGTYRANETLEIKAYHSTDGGLEWKEISINKLNDRQLKDGERVLILHGSFSDEEIQLMQDQVDTPSTSAAGMTHGA
ncbi:MAG: hypothetical protein ACPGQL_09135 [Thermoplasmatota archaeon]